MQRGRGGCGGEQALPRLVTADVRLAPGCGIDAVEAICADKPVPMIFITATPAEVRARLPGNPIVQKPFDAVRLAEAVRVLIATKNHGGGA